MKPILEEGKIVDYGLAGGAIEFVPGQWKPKGNAFNHLMMKINLALNHNSTRSTIFVSSALNSVSVISQLRDISDLIIC
jgi:hypothetical protein